MRFEGFHQVSGPFLWGSSNSGCNVFGGGPRDSYLRLLGNGLRPSGWRYEVQYRGRLGSFGVRFQTPD